MDIKPYEMLLSTASFSFKILVANLSASNVTVNVANIHSYYIL